MPVSYTHQENVKTIDDQCIFAFLLLLFGRQIGQGRSLMTFIEPLLASLPFSELAFEWLVTCLVS